MSKKPSPSVYQALYAELDYITPIQGDCGELCNKACCKNINDEMGMYLLPNEHTLFSKEDNWLAWEIQKAEDYYFPDSWQGDIYFVNCKKPCPREKRPLQCRTFPLAPHLTPQGQLVLIRDNMELPYKCPLISSKMDLQQDFIEKIYQVWSTLLEYSLIYDLIEYDSAERKTPLDIVYP